MCICVCAYIYICLYGHKYICIVVYRHIWQYVKFPFLIILAFFLSFHPVSVFDLTSGTFEVILDFYFAKVPLPGNMESIGTSPIAQKVFMTLRNHRLRFPGNFFANCLPYVPLWAAVYLAHKRFEMTVTPE